MECYVLNDVLKTAVISQRGMGRALGLSSGGSKLPRFLATNAISALVGPELAHKLAQPVKFQYVTGGPEQSPPSVIHGFGATILIDLCRIIIQAEADGKLLKWHKRVAAQAHIILGASAKSGIKGLVYALAEYGGVEELPPFLPSNNLKPFISKDLMDSKNPIAYRPLSGGRIAFGSKH